MKKVYCKTATFQREQLSRIKRAKTLLEKAIYDSCYDNRDTQMLEKVVEELKKVIEYQFNPRE